MVRLTFVAPDPLGSDEGVSVYVAFAGNPVAVRLMTDGKVVGPGVPAPFFLTMAKTDIASSAAARSASHRRTRHPQPPAGKPASVAREASHGE